MSVSLADKAKEFNIEMVDISITHLVFGREFMHAVEAKQVAQQEAERQKFVVLKEEQERQAAVIRAEGESSAAKLISEAYKEVGMSHLELRRIEAALEIATTLARSPNITYLPGGNNLLLNIGTK